MLRVKSLIALVTSKALKGFKKNSYKISQNWSRKRANTSPLPLLYLSSFQGEMKNI